MPNYEKNGQKSNFVDISSNNQVKKLYTKKGRVRRIVCLVLSVLLLVGGSGMLYYYNTLDSLNYKELDDNSGSDSSSQTATDASVAQLEGDGNNMTLSSGELLQNSKELNVMLFGEDNSDETEKYGRSDTMLMLTIDNNHKKIKLTSFQRDTLVYIPNYGNYKLNASYSLGGASLAIQTIESNFGVKIDRYAVVDFESFKEIIDVLGGIDLTLTDEDIQYINYQMYKNGQADDMNTITDSAGTVHLDGQQALWYARDRGLTVGEDGNEIGITGDDWSRTQHQRTLLDTVFTSLKSADLTQIITIVGKVGPLVTTNFKKDEITALVSHALTYLSYDSEQYTVPDQDKAGTLWNYNNYAVTSDGATSSVIEILDMDALRNDFAAFIFEELFTGTTSATTSSTTSATSAAQ